MGAAALRLDITPRLSPVRAQRRCTPTRLSPNARRAPLSPR